MRSMLDVILREVILDPNLVSSQRPRSNSFWPQSCKGSGDEIVPTPELFPFVQEVIFEMFLFRQFLMFDTTAVSLASCFFYSIVFGCNSLVFIGPSFLFSVINQSLFCKQLTNKLCIFTAGIWLIFSLISSFSQDFNHLYCTEECQMYSLLLIKNIL